MTQEIPSDDERNISEASLSQGEPEATWEEVKYEVYGNFQDSDRYQLPEHMAAMREDMTESSDKDESDTEYETAVEELVPEASPWIKYLSMTDFRNVNDKDPFTSIACNWHAIRSNNHRSQKR